MVGREIGATNPCDILAIKFFHCGGETANVRLRSSFPTIGKTAVNRFYGRYFAFFLSVIVSSSNIRIWTVGEEFNEEQMAMEGSIVRMSEERGHGYSCLCVLRPQKTSHFRVYASLVA